MYVIWTLSVCIIFLYLWSFLNFSFFCISIFTIHTVVRFFLPLLVWVFYIYWFWDYYAVYLWDSKLILLIKFKASEPCVYYMKCPLLLSFPMFYIFSNLLLSGTKLLPFIELQMLLQTWFSSHEVFSCFLSIKLCVTSSNLSDYLAEYLVWVSISFYM